MEKLKVVQRANILAYYRISKVIIVFLITLHYWLSWTRRVLSRS